MLFNFNFNEFNGGPTTPKDLEESIDLHMAKLDLIDEHCGLKHGPEDMDVEVPMAVNYLCQYFGFNKEDSITELLRVPICEDCVKGLYDDDWVLIYCVTCNNSQWIWKPKSQLHLDFNTDVVWLDECPRCKDEEG